jgi:hypothetical protein
MKGLFEIAIPEELMLSAPDSNGSNKNAKLKQQLREYGINMALRGWKTWNGDGYLHANVKELSADEVMLIAANGGDVKYWNPIISIPINRLDNQIPKGLSNRSYFIGDIETIHTWRTWRSSAEAYPIVEVSNRAYFISSTFGNTLPLSELMILYSVNQLELVEEIPVVE